MRHIHLLQQIIVFNYPSKVVLPIRMMHTDSPDFWSRSPCLVVQLPFLFVPLSHETHPDSMLFYYWLLSTYSYHELHATHEFKYSS